MGRYIHSLSLDVTIMVFHRAVFELQAPKAVIKGVFSRSYCCSGNVMSVQIMLTTCSPMVGQFFVTIIVASSDKKWL